jgi:predicted house-cleaning noncanonical NTP pyrophosphatase (MazG superfamily)
MADPVGVEGFIESEAYYLLCLMCAILSLVLAVVQETITIAIRPLPRMAKMVDILHLMSLLVEPQAVRAVDELRQTQQ